MKNTPEQPLPQGVLKGGRYVKQKSGKLKLETRTLNINEARKASAATDQARDKGE